MNLRIYIAPGLLVMAQKVCADEQLPVLKVGSEVFTNVTVRLGLAATHSVRTPRI